MNGLKRDFVLSGAALIAMVVGLLTIASDPPSLLNGAPMTTTAPDSSST